MNGSGAELDYSDGRGAWWVKHSWVLGGEGYQNWELKPQQNYGDGYYVEDILLEYDISMKIGVKNDSIYTDYNARRSVIDSNTRRVYYQLARYEMSRNNDPISEEKFKLVWKCKKRKSTFSNDIREFPKLIW